MSLPSFNSVYSLGGDAHGSAAVVVSLAASFCASLVSGFVADGMGRKKFFYVAAAFHVIGVVIQAAGLKFAALLVGRIVTGCTVGMFSMSVPLCKDMPCKKEK
jgi:predicted MFS family arabinose efflux permease